MTDFATITAMPFESLQGILDQYFWRKMDPDYEGRSTFEMKGDSMESTIRPGQVIYYDTLDTLPARRAFF